MPRTTPPRGKNGRFLTRAAARARRTLRALARRSNTKSKAGTARRTTMAKKASSGAGSPRASTRRRAAAATVRRASRRAGRGLLGGAGALGGMAIDGAIGAAGAIVAENIRVRYLPADIQDSADKAALVDAGLVVGARLLLGRGRFRSVLDKAARGAVTIALYKLGSPRIAEALADRALPQAAGRATLPAGGGIRGPWNYDPNASGQLSGMEPEQWGGQQL